MSIIPNINNEALQLLPDIALWKQQIADAINERGGNANPNSAFTQLAQDIEDLENFPTTGFEYISEIYRPRTLMEAYINRSMLKKIECSYIFEITNNYAFTNCSFLEFIRFSELTEIRANTTFSGCPVLYNVKLDKLERIIGDYTFSNCTNLTNTHFPNVLEIRGQFTFSSCSNLKILSLPKISIISDTRFLTNANVITNLIFGTLVELTDIFHTKKSYLRNITIGVGTDITLPFLNWTATNVVAEGQSSIDELNSNLYNNLLTKLYDHSEDGETRILQIGWLDYITPENIAYANAKGWTITN